MTASTRTPGRIRISVLRTSCSLLLLAGVTACSSPSDQDPSARPTSGSPESGDTTDPGTSAPGEVTYALVDTEAEVATPTDAHPLGESLLVTQRAGRVVELVDDGTGHYNLAGVVVNLTDEVGSTAVEKGLLGLTTDPDGEHLYVNHTRASDGATVIREFPLLGEPGSLHVGESRELLVIEQPFPNHNGGDIVWGPDDMLWIGMGDGGGQGDPEGRAQRLTDPLGKILRIDPSLVGSGTDLAPADNPYADGTDGAGDAANPLVWARGVRNPWRISFDEATGDLWIADVGQNEVEEIDVLRRSAGWNPGANLGWDRREGDRPFAHPGPERGWPDFDEIELVEPLHTYTHADGCSISGGFVYRGDALTALQGRYLFSDFCASGVRSVTEDGSAAPLGIAGSAVISINADENGEPLVLDSEGIHRVVAG